VNQREYNDRRTMTDLRERVTILEAQLLALSEVARENERLTLDIMKIMEIVCDYVVESNDVGGIDANDLASRLEAAGFDLPDEVEE
jgi:uncharacterized protein YigA (DUF484 family)